MKLNNKGWGFNEFIMLLSLLFVCLVVVVILYTKLIKSEEKHMDVKNEFIGDSTIKSYIDLEDEITEQAKKYNVNESSDMVIIKFNSLVKNGYIKKVVDPQNKKECSGYVVYAGITKGYKTYLSCPGNYQTSDYNKDLE